MNELAKVIIEKLENKYCNDTDALEKINRAKISIEYHNDTSNMYLYEI